MAKVVLVSWSEGLQKVSLTKLQMEMLGKSLKSAKSDVDLLLDDKEVVIEVGDPDLAQAFMEAAEKIGANCKFIAD
jgi:chaperonin cofactor prefoldin